jgi:hypothetical protein
VTAIEKTTEMIRNPAVRDTVGFVRESLKMNSAARQTSYRMSRVNKESENGVDLMKKIRLKLQSHAAEVIYKPVKLPEMGKT